MKWAKGNECVFFEDASKGWRHLEKRKVLLQAIEALEPGDVLLAYCSDRMSRNMDTMGAIRYLVREKGAKIEYADGSASGASSIEGVIMEAVAGIMAVLEKEKIGARVSSAHGVKKSRKEAMGMVPFGYMQEFKCYKNEHGAKVKAPLVENPEEMKALTKMMDLRTSGATFREIADLMNAEGFLNRNGQPFDFRGIHRILSRKSLELVSGESREAH